MNYNQASDRLLICSSYERFEEFLSIKDKLDDKTYWRILSKAYTMSDNLFLFSKEIKECFLEPRKNKMFLMNKKEQKFYKDLPDNLTIYRGMTVEELNSENFGISWTLSKDVAEFFAFKYRRNQSTANLPKIIHEMNVSKKFIIGYFNDRKEDEIIHINT